ncbi:MAG: CmpX, partial [uncultured Frankineae bacterium]
VRTARSGPGGAGHRRLPVRHDLRPEADRLPGHPARRLLHRQADRQAGGQGPGEGRVRPCGGAGRDQKGAGEELLRRQRHRRQAGVLRGVHPVPVRRGRHAGHRGAAGAAGGVHRADPADHRGDRAGRHRRGHRRHRQVVHRERAGRAVLRQGAGQRREHPDPAGLREVGAGPGRHRHHGHRAAAVHDPGHRRRCDHHRCGWRSDQADAGPLGEHAQQGRERERERQGAGTHLLAQQHPHHGRLPERDLQPAQHSGPL